MDCDIAASAQVSLNGAGQHSPARSTPSGSTSTANKTGVQINYQPIGSGVAIKALTDKTVDFGASDAIMTPSRSLPRGHRPHPMTSGSVVLGVQPA